MSIYEVSWEDDNVHNHVLVRMTKQQAVDLANYFKDLFSDYSIEIWNEQRALFDFGNFCRLYDFEF